MNIVVCLKQVPKKDSILRIAADGKWIDERDISYEMSEADSYALEEALRLGQQGGFTRVFLDESRPLQLLLAQWLARTGDHPLRAYALYLDGLVEIGKGARVTAQSGVHSSLPESAFVSGTPAFQNRDWLKACAIFRALPDLRRTIAGLTEHEGSTWFVKLSGDVDAVGAARPAFMNLLESLRFDAANP